MKERLKELRKTLGLSQDAMASRIGVTRGAVCRLETGSNGFTNQTVMAICREFNVSEEWLRTGAGSMFVEMSRAELAAKIVGSALNTDDDFVLNTFIALGQLAPAEWEVIKKFVEKIRSN